MIFSKPPINGGFVVQVNTAWFKKYKWRRFLETRRLNEYPKGRSLTSLFLLILIQNLYLASINLNDYGAKIQTHLVKVIWGSLIGK